MKIKNNQLTIKGISIPMYIGIYDWERKYQQIVTVDIKATLDKQRFTIIDDTLDYDSLCNYIMSYKNQKINLIEQLAEDIAKNLLNEFSIIHTIQVKIKKKVLLNGAPNHISFSCFMQQFQK